MSLLKLFQPKRAADAAPNKTQIARAAAPTTPAATPTGTKPSAAPAPSNRAGSHANPDAADAVKSVLAAFAQEAIDEANKVEAIGQKLIKLQHHLLNNAGPHQAHAANAKAREDIKAILIALNALSAESRATAIQLQTMSR